MKSLSSKTLTITLFLGLCAPTFTSHAFLSPKQKYAQRMERKARYENPEYEYIYYNKVINAFYGGICLPLGLILSINGFFNPHLDALEKVLFSFAGPFTTMASIKMLNNAFHSGAALIITPAGIIINENGFTLWHEIDKGIISYSNPCGITLDLIDGSSIFIYCDMLNITLDKLLVKINRFKKFRLRGDSFTFIHDE